MKKCPTCDFELLEDQTICPNCGVDLKGTVTIDESNEQNIENDNIKWSEYQDVPLESVMEQLSDLQDSEEPLEASEEIDSLKKEDSNKVSQNDPFFEENSILADYIKKHKEGSSEEQSPSDASTDKKFFSAETLPNDRESDMTKSEVENEASGTSELSVGEQPIADSEEETESLKDSQSENVIDEQGGQIPPKNPNLTEETRSKKTKKSYFIAAAAIVLVGSGWWYLDHQQKVEAAKQEELSIENAITTIESEMDSFFLDENQQFIQPEKTIDDITTLMDELNKYADNPKYDELATKGAQIQEKLANINQVNGYFTGNVVVGDQLVETVHVKPDQTIDMNPLTENDVFSDLINQALEKAETETKQLNSAKASVEKLVGFLNDGSLDDAVKREDFEAGKSEVNALFDSAEKESLLSQLTSVEKALVAREKEAADRLAAEQAAAEQAAAEQAAAEQAAAEQAAAEQAAAEQAAAEQVITGGGSSSVVFNEGQEILSSNTPKKTNNQPIISTRQSDLDDATNPAWDWAPGVYEWIISQCIAKGYIVDGGFVLERVRIENGEGYYNLYATNTQSELLQGMSDSALPLYLVTINNKTGFFRGNGND